MDQKNYFYKNLGRVLESTKNEIILKGDLNAKEGNNSERHEPIIVQHGKDIESRNGRKLLQFFMEN